MDGEEIIRMLEIINGIPNGVSKERDRDTWLAIQKQFPGKYMSILRNVKGKNYKDFLEAAFKYSNECPYLLKQLRWSHI